jgi:hypothetical protein
MRKKIILGIILISSVLLTCNAYASQITFDTVIGTGSYHNGLDYLSDGTFPTEGTRWSKDSTWWLGTESQFTFYFDSAYYLTDIILSVDNNDDYLIEYTMDGVGWYTLFTIDETDGDVLESDGGLDIMSSVSADDEYVSAIDFETVVATGIRVSATDGDGRYSLSEIQAFGTPVPETATIFLLGLGLLGIAGVLRKKE